MLPRHSCSHCATPEYAIQADCEHPLRKKNCKEKSVQEDRQEGLNEEDWSKRYGEGSSNHSPLALQTLPRGHYGNEESIIKDNDQHNSQKNVIPRQDDEDRFDSTRIREDGAFEEASRGVRSLLATTAIQETKKNGEYSLAPIQRIVA